MAWKLTFLVYSRLEASLNGYKTGKAVVDWLQVRDGLASTGSSLLLMAVLLVLLTVVVRPTM